MQNYRALLWDNDGVLVDTERLYYRATRETLATAGFDLTPSLYFENFLLSSRGTAHVVAACSFDEAKIENLRVTRNRRYLDLLASEPIAVAGVEEVLQALRPHFCMGIVTSARREHFEAIHRRTGFLQYFDFVLAENDYAESKPAPDPYLAGVARSGFSKAQCLAIEDTPRGLLSAGAAGIDCWILPSELTANADFSQAKRILKSVSEIASLLRPGTAPVK
jgi:HAD superfamily hydrolase (TIGR01509 family)